MFQILGVFAEFERAMIVERVHAGLRRAGKRLGRPRVTTDVEQGIRRELMKGTGIRAVAWKLRVGAGTVQRIKAAAAA
jgi:DNA invertase Pin-like site-specific DNA recombinase